MHFWPTGNPLDVEVLNFEGRAICCEEDGAAVDDWTAVCPILQNDVVITAQQPQYLHREGFQDQIYDAISKDSREGVPENNSGCCSTARYA